MGKKYTKDEVIEMCQKALDEDVSLFYTKNFVNYLGTVRDDNSLYYTEVVAEFVLNNIEKFKSIPMIRRGRSYDNNHKGEYDENTNRLEEKNAIDMFRQTKKSGNMNYLGRIVDYQIPLKSVQNDKAGKIDLLAETDREVYILELKKEDSKETLLRCVLEGYTYLRTVDQEKLLDDFRIDRNKPIYAAPFVFKGGNQWKELQGDEKAKHPNLIELMKQLNIKGPFYIVPQYDVEC